MDTKPTPIEWLRTHYLVVKNGGAFSSTEVIDRLRALADAEARKVRAGFAALGHTLVTCAHCRGQGVTRVYGSMECCYLCGGRRECSTKDIAEEVADRQATRAYRAKRDRCG